MTIYRKVIWSVGLAFVLSSTLLVADKSAKDIVKKVYAQIGSMDKYAFTAVVVDTALMGSESKTYKQNVSVKIDRPSQFRTDTKGDLKHKSTYLNDGMFTMINYKHGYYAQLKTAKGIDKTLDFLFDKFGIRTPLSTLMYSDMGKRVKFKTHKYFGIVDVAGVACDYIAFKNVDKEIHVWITKGDAPLVKALSIINEDTRINVTLHWELNPKFSANDFVFIAPKNAVKISVTPAY